MTDPLDVKMYRDFVAIAIEKSLSKMGTPVADEVSIRLNEMYNCDFADCLEHPEYLTKVLKDIFGKSYLKIVKLINEQLSELAFDKPIGSFLKIIAGKEQVSPNSDIDNYPPLKEVDNLNERNHSMLLYDNAKYGNLVKYHYLENGLKNGEHCICLTHDEVTLVEDEISSLGIDLEHFKRKNLLHIHQIENILEKRDGLESGSNALLKTVTRGIKQPYRIIGRFISDVSTEEGIQAELLLEHKFHSNFNKYPGSFLCIYDVNEIEGSKRPIWLTKLFQNHHHLIYATDPANANTFDPNLLTTFQDNHVSKK